MMFDATHDPIHYQLVPPPSPTNIHFPHTPHPVVLVFLLKLTENFRIYECAGNRDITLLDMEGGEH